ncbi:MAG: heavy-metal-associated domain-containing protein [Pedobacter sp.]|nr:MAG: heavy-metal-associated domain-containing protein [Pedobacter sp.]
MKYLLIIGAFFAFLNTSRVSAQQINSAEIQISGLTCSMCTQATEKSMRTLSYIDTMEPDLNKNLFKVTFKNPEAVDFDQLQRKVKDAGFSVGNLQAVINFKQVKVDENGQAIIGNKVYRFANVKNKVLNGPTKVNVIDKNFMSASKFKQKQAQVKIASLASGMAIVNGKNTRVYHLSL